jgi:hypothetical protein
MKAHEILIEMLEAITDLTDIVDDRIYWPHAPNAISKPCVVVNLITGDRIHNLDFVRPRMQVSAFSKDEDECADMAEIVVSNLKNYKGSVNGYFVVATYQVDQFFFDNTWWHAPVEVQMKYQEGS